MIVSAAVSMKFGRRLNAGLKNPAWTASYLRYDTFKDLVVELSQLDASCSPDEALTALADELRKDVLRADSKRPLPR